MNLEETTQLYATVLRQLLPVGGYETAQESRVAKDVYAHAKALAQTDLDAKRLLNILKGIPIELLNEYETELGLPLKCRVTHDMDIDERIRVLKFIRDTQNVLNRTYLEKLLEIFDVELLELVKFRPIQCIASCTMPLNTEQLRYKVLCKLRSPVEADMACILEHYLPAYLRIDILEVARRN